MMDDEAEDCRALVTAESLQVRRAQQVNGRRYRAALGAASLLAVGGCLILLRPRVAGRAEAVRDMVGLNAGNDHCEDFFNAVEVRDCSPKNYWECLYDDGSWGYTCCCKHGFGDFSNNENETTGMIKWASSYNCIDLGTPFEQQGVSFSTGPAFVQQCDWGDNHNRHFHLPVAGVGTIRWASHPKYCLGVKDGVNSAGNEVHLQRCWGTPQWWLDFNIENKGHGNHTHKLIRWAANPDKCLRIAEPKDGAKVLLAECQEGDGLQHLDVLPLLKKPSKASYPRLFCLSLMLPFGSEPKLMEAQFLHQVGIFGCLDHAIYSNESIKFRHGNRSFETDVMPGSMAVQFGGRWHSALNTDIFIRFWGKVVEDMRAWRNHWTVKLDPDCVFFPWRLQQMLNSSWRNGDPGKPVFLNNCHLGMHGPIEVLGRDALSVYKSKSRACSDGAPYSHKQEDFYFRECWKLLGIEQMDVYNLLQESAFACDERSSTRDGRHPCFSKQVSFHPLKSAKGYLECHRRGDSMRWSTPFIASNEVPAHWNHRHG